MKTFEAIPGKPIPLGRLGENERLQVIFDVSAWLEELPGAAIGLINRLPHAEEAYPVILGYPTNGKISWIITSAELSVKGDGDCELIATVGTVVAKSEYYRTVILDALDGSGEVPDQWETYQAQFTAIAGEATAAQAGAEAAQEAAETAQGKAEDAQAAAETAQGKAEDAQTGAEAAQTAAETAQGKAEDAQEAAEAAQAAAETAQEKAEDAQEAAEAAQAAAETAQGLAEDAQEAAEAAQAAAETAQGLAEDAAELAQKWATGGTSGTPSATNNAEYWAGEAQEAASDAAASAQEAASAAQEAAEEALAGKADKANTVLTTTLSRGRKANTTAGTGSIAFGSDAEASGNYSTSTGYYSTASGYVSHAEGQYTEASGDYSHAEGYGYRFGSVVSKVIASGTGSHAEGSATEASGDFSHAEGEATIASGRNEKVSGKFNVDDNVSWPAWTANTHYYVGDIVTRQYQQYDVQTGEYVTIKENRICKTENSDSSFTSSKWWDMPEKFYAEIVGNGIDFQTRSNARALDWKGNEYLGGDLYVGCNEDSSGGTKLVTYATDEETEAIITGWEASA